MNDILVVFGICDFTKELYCWIDKKEHHHMAFLDETHKDLFMGFPVNSKIEIFKYQSFVIAEKVPFKRAEMWKRATECGLNPALPIFGPNSIYGHGTYFGRGSIMCPGSIVTSECTIGENVLINMNVTVENNTIIEPHCVISPGANISGNCVIKAGTIIGKNACIQQGVTIGENVVIGMGCVITKDVPAGKTMTSARSYELNSLDGGKLIEFPSNRN